MTSIPTIASKLESAEVCSVMVIDPYDGYVKRNCRRQVSRNGMCTRHANLAVRGYTLADRAAALTADELRGLVSYDPETGVFRWRRRKQQLAGSPDVLGYIRIQIHGKLFKAHRLAWLYVYGEWPSLTIDHANRIPGDNRISNLRIADCFQQAHNHSDNRKGRSLPRGVSWSERDKKYRAQIRCFGQSHALGLHDDIESAAAAYRDASLRLHGEFSIFRTHLEKEASK
jgi:hypothetical protein